MKTFSELTESARSSSYGTVIQMQSRIAATRRGPIKPELLSILERLARELNVRIEVHSGGQRGHPTHKSHYTPSEAERYKQYGRTGSPRHDVGNAADIRIYAPGIGNHPREKDLLNDNNPTPQEKALLQKFVALGKNYGLKEFGSGKGYMDGGNVILATFHVGLLGRDTPTSDAVLWGGSSTPRWLKDAFNNPNKYAGIDISEPERQVKKDEPTPPIPKVRQDSFSKPTEKDVNVGGNIVPKPTEKAVNVGGNVGSRRGFFSSLTGSGYKKPTEKAVNVGGDIGSKRGFFSSLKGSGYKKPTEPITGEEKDFVERIKVIVDAIKRNIPNVSNKALIPLAVVAIIAGGVFAFRRYLFDRKTKDMASYILRDPETKTMLLLLRQKEKRRVLELLKDPKFRDRVLSEL